MSTQNVEIEAAINDKETGTIPAGAQNISLILKGAKGGSGGFDSGGPGGDSGKGRRGTFSIPSSNNNRSFDLRCGSKGANGPGGSGAAIGGNGGGVPGNGDGGKGGDDGTSGWSGCGGGGGAASVFYLGGNLVAIAGGGGGGGGGSFSCGGAQRPGGNGGNGGAWSNNSNINADDGDAGANKGGGDGGGGGGGGGGHSGGGGGGAGTDCNNGGGGGGGGSSRYNGNKLTLSNQGTNDGQGEAKLTYTLQVAEITSFTANPTSVINNGSQSVTLSWNVDDSISQSINQGVGSVSASGSTNVAPTSTKQYTLTAQGLAGDDSANVTVTVYQPVVVNISANPNPLISGQNSTLSWNTSGDASSASINQGIGAVLLTSETSISPSVTTTYTINASGNGGSDSDSVTVVVNQIPQISYNAPNTINYGDSLVFPVTYRYATNGVNGTIVYTMRNPANGNATTVSESVSLPGTNSDSSGGSITNDVTANIPWGLHGPFEINMTLSASGGGGNTPQSDTVQINVDELPDSINIPDTREAIPEDQVEAPDDGDVLSDPIVVEDIDVAAEIKSNRPIKVRFDENDPDIESNWKNLRQI